MFLSCHIPFLMVMHESNDDDDSDDDDDDDDDDFNVINLLSAITQCKRF